MSVRFDYDKRTRAGIKVTQGNSGPSLTSQAHQLETDINYIVARFQRTGELPPSNRQGQYLDVSDVQQLDPTTAINQARQTIQQVQNDLQLHREKQQKQQQEQEKQTLMEQLRQELIQQGLPPPANTNP